MKLALLYPCFGLFPAKPASVAPREPHAGRPASTPEPAPGRWIGHEPDERGTEEPIKCPESQKTRCISAQELRAGGFDVIGAKHQDSGRRSQTEEAVLSVGGEEAVDKSVECPQ